MIIEPNVPYLVHLYQKNKEDGIKEKKQTNHRNKATSANCDDVKLVT